MQRGQRLVLVLGCVSFTHPLHAWRPKGLPNEARVDEKHQDKLAALLLATSPVSARQRVVRPVTSAQNAAIATRGTLATVMNDDEDPFAGLPWWANVNTKGGIMSLATIFTTVVISIFNGLAFLGTLSTVQTSQFLIVSMVIPLFVWVISYGSRVRNKDSTYAVQLKQYEQAVMQKRLDAFTDEELAAISAEADEQRKDLVERAKAAEARTKYFQ